MHCIWPSNKKNEKQNINNIIGEKTWVIRVGVSYTIFSLGGFNFAFFGATFGALLVLATELVFCSCMSKFHKVRSIKSLIW